MLFRLSIFVVAAYIVLAEKNDGVLKFSKGGESLVAEETKAGLYAGASAGGGFLASAGLHGSSLGGGSYGGGLAAEKEIELIKDAGIDTVGSGSISAAYKSHVVAPISASFTKHVEVVKKPVEVDVIQHVPTCCAPVPAPPPEAKPVTTVIQKTVIPNYEKKIIKVPSYEEKVVRVPTVVEKEVWVPAAPTIIEKEVQIAQPAPPTVVQTVETVPVYRTKFRKHPLFFRKHFSIGGGFGSGYTAASGGGYAGGYDGEYGGDSVYTASVQKHVSPQLYQDIFNIPIATLGAVGKLVGGIAGGTSVSGSVGVSKSIGASKSFAASAYH